MTSQIVRDSTSLYHWLICTTAKVAHLLPTEVENWEGQKKMSKSRISFQFSVLLLVTWGPGLCCRLESFCRFVFLSCPDWTAGLDCEGRPDRPLYLIAGHNSPCNAARPWHQPTTVTTSIRPPLASYTLSCSACTSQVSHQNISDLCISPIGIAMMRQ